MQKTILIWHVKVTSPLSVPLCHDVRDEILDAWGLRDRLKRFPHTKFPIHRS